MSPISDQQRATKETAENLQRVAKSLALQKLTQLSLPEVDAVVEQVAKIILCMSLEIFGVKVPYLNPVDCDKKTLSTLSLVEDNDQIFWTPNGSSREFRVLWLNEEIVRCQIEAGVCDLYVP